MDDESAEIELLEQNINKTHQISRRMISVLDSFDTRLAKLEKSILPLYTSAQVLTRRTQNIDKTLLKIDEVGSQNEDLDAEEALILRGPQPGQLDTYKSAIERLNALITFKSPSSDHHDAPARLVETGAKKLTLLYTKLVAEGSSGSPPGGTSIEFTILPFPADLLASLRPLVSFLRTLPLPATHPTHPAAQGIRSVLVDAQKGYADMRGAWSKKCLSPLAKNVVDEATSYNEGGGSYEIGSSTTKARRDGVEAGKSFGKWVELVLTVAEDEYNLLCDLAPLTSGQLVAQAYGALLSPILGLFGTTLGSLIGLIKRSLHKHTFLALSTYEALLKLLPRWESLLNLREGGGGSNEVKEGLNSLRAVCLRSFPELIADIKSGATSKNNAGLAEYTGAVTDFTQSTVTYLSKLPIVKGAVGSALLSLGDGNWKMGEGVQVGKGSKLPLGGEGGDAEQTILEHYIHDVITTTIASITALSKASRRPAVAGTFLINNIHYLNAHLLQSPSDPSLPGMMAKPTQDLLARNQRTAKAGYFDSNFGPLMQALSDDPKEGRTAGKERFTRFYDLLEEVLERHRVVRVLDMDELSELGREGIAEEACKLVVPAFRRFVQRMKDREFSKNIKMSPDEVESQLKSIFN
ncbi:Cullin repeat-like-containing domain protein [Amanita rubescens]|nr:Cullin repeat-like-containing domain protein [Amanita rubescens]